ncbi:MAG: TadE/TadG family type IV pilus assembly protein [Croceibacterium sp.]
MRALLFRIRRDKTGAAMVEFALLAPLTIVMMLGVMQLGIALQNYNAVRNVSADVARYAMVQYATGNTLTNDQLRNFALSSGRGAPYLLSSDRMSATVTNATTQRVTGATEKTLTINYQIPSLLDPMGLRGPYITYTRPVFLTTPS